MFSVLAALQKSFFFAKNLAKKLVETKKNIVYLLVYLLVELSLILSVTTATVERAFSAMKFVKNRLHNRMGDQWMNECLVIYIEKDVFDSKGNEVIMKCFQKCFYLSFVEGMLLMSSSFIFKYN
jgi:C4-dicarboxylate transporter